MQAFLLYARRYQYSVIALAEIYWTGEVAVLIRDQGCVLSELGFFPQVLDHGNGGVIQRHCTLAGG